VVTFPCIYLGLPLKTRKSTRTELQPLLLKIANQLLGWKRDFLTYPDREFLVKADLSSMPTHFLTVFKLPQWAIKNIDRFRRSFFWRGKSPNQVTGGHCLVNWLTCLRPRKWGGLGFKDLEKFGRALRLKWFWQSWEEHERQWKNLFQITDKIDRALFFSSTIIHVVNGKDTAF
jgi:hypothetical protein